MPAEGALLYLLSKKYNSINGKLIHGDDTNGFGFNEKFERDVFRWYQLIYNSVTEKLIGPLAASGVTVSPATFALVMMSVARYLAKARHYDLSQWNISPMDQIIRSGPIKLLETLLKSSEYPYSKGIPQMYEDTLIDKYLPSNGEVSRRDLAKEITKSLEAQIRTHPELSADEKRAQQPREYSNTNGVSDRSNMATYKPTYRPMKQKQTLLDFAVHPSENMSYEELGAQMQDSDDQRSEVAARGAQLDQQLQHAMNTGANINVISRLRDEQVRNQMYLRNIDADKRLLASQQNRLQELTAALKKTNEQNEAKERSNTAQMQALKKQIDSLKSTVALTKEQVHSRAVNTATQAAAAGVPAHDIASLNRINDELRTAMADIKGANAAADHLTQLLQKDKFELNELLQSIAAEKKVIATQIEDVKKALNQAETHLTGLRAPHALVSREDFDQCLDKMNRLAEVLHQLELEKSARATEIRAVQSLALEVAAHNTKIETLQTTLNALPSDKEGAVKEIKELIDKETALVKTKLRDHIDRVETTVRDVHNRLGDLSHTVQAQAGAMMNQIDNTLERQERTMAIRMRNISDSNARLLIDKSPTIESVSQNLTRASEAQTSRPPPPPATRNANVTPSPPSPPLSFVYETAARPVQRLALPASATTPASAAFTPATDKRDEQEEEDTSRALTVNNRPISSLVEPSLFPPMERFEGQQAGVLPQQAPIQFPLVVNYQAPEQIETDEGYASSTASTVRVPDSRAQIEYRERVGPNASIVTQRKAGVLTKPGRPETSTKSKEIPKRGKAIIEAIKRSAARAVQPPAQPPVVEEIDESTPQRPPIKPVRVLKPFEKAIRKQLEHVTSMDSGFKGDLTALTRPIEVRTQRVRAKAAPTYQEEQEADLKRQALVAELRKKNRNLKPPTNIVSGAKRGDRDEQQEEEEETDKDAVKAFDEEGVFIGRAPRRSGVPTWEDYLAEAPNVVTRIWNGVDSLLLPDFSARSAGIKADTFHLTTKAEMEQLISTVIESFVAFATQLISGDQFNKNAVASGEIPENRINLSIFKVRVHQDLEDLLLPTVDMASQVFGPVVFPRMDMSFGNRQEANVVWEGIQEIQAQDLVRRANIDPDKVLPPVIIGDNLTSADDTPERANEIVRIAIIGANVCAGFAHFVAYWGLTFEILEMKPMHVLMFNVLQYVRYYSSPAYIMIVREHVSALKFDNKGDLNVYISQLFLFPLLYAAFYGVKAANLDVWQPNLNSDRVRNDLVTFINNIDYDGDTKHVQTNRLVRVRLIALFSYYSQLRIWMQGTLNPRPLLEVDPRSQYAYAFNIASYRFFDKQELNAITARFIASNFVNLSIANVFKSSPFILYFKNSDLGPTMSVDFTRPKENIPAEVFDIDTYEGNKGTRMRRDTDHAPSMMAEAPDPKQVPA